MINAIKWTLGSLTLFLWLPGWYVSGDLFWWIGVEEAKDRMLMLLGVFIFGPIGFLFGIWLWLEEYESHARNTPETPCTATGAILAAKACDDPNTPYSAIQGDTESQ